MADSVSDTLLQKLGGVLKSKAELMVPSKDQNETVQEELRFLRMFFRYTSKWCTKNQKMEGRHKYIKGLTLSSSMWKFYLNVQNMDESMTNEIGMAISDLLKQIELIKPKVREYIQASRSSESDTPKTVQAVLGLVSFVLENLKKLLDFKGDVIAPVKDQIETLREVLSSWRTFLSQMLIQCADNEKAKDLLIYIAPAANDVGCAILLLHVDKMDELMAKEMNVVLSDILEKFEIIKEKADHYVRAPKALTKTNKIMVGFVDFQLEYLQELLNFKADLAASMMDQIKTVQEELMLLRAFLVDTADQQIEHQELEDLAMRVGDVAYELEAIIDSFMVKDDPVWYPTLLDVLKDIKLIKAEIIDFYDKSSYENAVLNSTKRVSSPANTPMVDEVVVGLEDETVTMIEQLTRPATDLDVISIVGMAGLGKTTLANKIFNDPLIVYHFDIRAWCSVSPVYRKNELLLSLLSSVIELTNKFFKMSDQSLAEELYRRLKGKRYLIVMDDIWNIEPWNDLRRSFPNDSNGSRIIITSRLRDAALQVRPDRLPHFLRFLSDDESWELLQKKVFQKESCPHKLWSVGKQIAKNCQGLPLAVVTAALLAKKDKAADWWEQVAEIVGDSKQMVNTLELSFNNLPNHLKHCFLYCGAFIEYKEIPVRKLICLWIAEGFIKKTRRKSLEEVAEEYLMELIDRSLLLVAQKRSSGGVKACHIHYLLRDLCLRKIKEENFLQLIHGSSTTHERCRRLCIHSQPSYFFQSKQSNPEIRSILCFATRDKTQTGSCDVSIISHGFKLLRVLDMGYINMGNSFPRGIEMLIYLRYLAMQGEFSSIPTTITNLWKLETLIVKGLSGEIVLTDTILNMVRLRHLLVNDFAAFNSPFNARAILDSSFQLENLQTLSTPALSYDKEEKIMRRFPNLRKLRCIFLESWDMSKMHNQFPRLDILAHLESLKVFYHGQVRYPYVFSFPVNLRKLTLSKFSLPWEEMSAIARSLPKLEVLKLLSEACEGKRWETSEGEFPKLKFLKLDSLNIAEWIVSSSTHFPNLQQLVLLGCPQLEEIPPSLGEIPTLQTIEVNCCCHSAAISAIQIKEDQQEMGNDELEVLIYPPDLVHQPSP